jgi:ankyrin repeat protein
MPLHVAAELGRREIAKLLLSYGADKESRTEMVDRDGKTEYLDSYDVASRSKEYGTLSEIQDY